MAILSARGFPTQSACGTPPGSCKRLHALRVRPAYFGSHDRSVVEQNVAQMFRRNAAHGMHGFVATQPFPLKVGYHLGDDGFSGGDLILNYDVDRGVQAHILNLDTAIAMEGHDALDPLFIF